MKDTLIVKITKEQAAALKAICDQFVLPAKSITRTQPLTQNLASDENLLPRAVGKH